MLRGEREREEEPYPISEAYIFLVFNVKKLVLYKEMLFFFLDREKQKKREN
jgi:hypothetical protein